MREDIKTLSLSKLIDSIDLFIYPTYVYAFHDAINQHTYKLCFRDSLREVYEIPDEDYEMIQVHYEYLKLKYG